MGEIITCPQCSKVIKQDMKSKPINTCPYCNAQLRISTATAVRSAFDSISNNKLMQEAIAVHPPFHMPVEPIIPSTPEVKIKGLAHLLSGEAAFVGLKQAVDELARTAPEDHDVLIAAFDLSVREIRYIEPHTLLFSGLDNNGHHAFVVCHFSQLLARVIYRPKAEKERIITGFARQSEE